MNVKSLLNKQTRLSGRDVATRTGFPFASLSKDDLVGVSGRSSTVDLDSIKRR